MKNNWIKELPSIAFRLKESNIENLELFQKSPVPSAVLHLIRAYGLSDIYPFVKDSEEFKKNGFENAIDWRNKRGRVSALAKALGWLGFKDCVIVARGALNRWRYYQIGVNKKVSPNMLKNIQGVCKLSAPTRCQLERVFLINKDDRVIDLSGSNSTLSHGSVLSTDSGIIMKGGFVNDAG